MEIVIISINFTVISEIIELIFNSGCAYLDCFLLLVATWSLGKVLHYVDSFWTLKEYKKNIKGIIGLFVQS